MAINNLTPSTKSSILDFVKPFVSLQVLKDISVLLTPCCKPTWTYSSTTCDFNPEDGGTWGAAFVDSIVTVPALKNQTVTIIITTTAFSGGVLQHITLDSNGQWTGTLYSSWETNPSNFDVTVYIQAEGNKALYESDLISLTGISVCD